MVIMSPQVLIVGLVLAVVNSKGSPWDWQSGNVRLSKSRGQEQQVTSLSSKLVSMETSGNVSVEVGEDVKLACRVQNLRQYTVSWLRSRDTSVLAVGALTFSSDSRFQVLRTANDNNVIEYSLEIKNVQKGDIGWYDCQVNTEPKVSSRVFLDVINIPNVSSSSSSSIPPFNIPRDPEDKSDTSEASSLISGPRRLTLSVGSTLRLTCRIVEQTQRHVDVLYWRRETRVLSPEHDHRVKIAVDLNTNEEKNAALALLVISNLTLADSGEYACVTDVATPAIVDVHVASSSSSSSSYVTPASKADVAEALASDADSLSFLKLWIVGLLNLLVIGQPIQP